MHIVSHPPILVKNRIVGHRVKVTPAVLPSSPKTGPKRRQFVLWQTAWHNKRGLKKYRKLDFPFTPVFYDSNGQLSNQAYFYGLVRRHSLNGERDWYIPIAEVARGANITTPTAKKYLDQLAAQGQIVNDAPPISRAGQAYTRRALVKKDLTEGFIGVPDALAARLGYRTAMVYALYQDLARKNSSSYVCISDEKAAKIIGMTRQTFAKHRNRLVEQVEGYEYGFLYEIESANAGPRQWALTGAFILRDWAEGTNLPQVVSEPFADISHCRESKPSCIEIKEEEESKPSCIEIKEEEESKPSCIEIKEDLTKSEKLLCKDFLSHVYLLFTDSCYSHHVNLFTDSCHLNHAHAHVINRFRDSCLYKILYRVKEFNTVRMPVKAEYTLCLVRAPPFSSVKAEYTLCLVRAPPFSSRREK